MPTMDVEAVVDDVDDGDWEDDEGSVVSTASAASAASVAPNNNDTGLPDRDFRLKSVYDAVAGRVRVHEARAPKWAGASTRQHLDTILPPDEALYRGGGAPDRYEETDTYFAHESLPAGALPDSDLVKAVHHYASQYYEVLAMRGQKDMGENEELSAFAYARRRLLDERSMDETALLAFGILLEEAGRQALGANGDLVFTEVEENEMEEDEGERPRKRAREDDDDDDER